MKKLSSILTILCLIALAIIGCSKDSGSDNPTPNNGNGNGNNNQSSATAITPEFLNGTWSHVEFEYDGVRISNKTDYRDAWNCIKQGTYVFTNTRMTVFSSSYDPDTELCVDNTATLPYTVSGNKLTFEESGTKTVADLGKEGNYLTIALKDPDGKVHKHILTKVTNNGNNGNNGNNNTAKTATAKITISGVTNGVKVKVAESSFKGSVVLVETANVVNGSATINVSKYIGKKLYFIVANSNNENISAEVEKTIVEGDNAINLIATAKDYTVKIKVLNSGTPANGKKVYATDATSWRGIAAGLSFGSNADALLSSTKNATTNAQGIATFSEFRPMYNNQEYVFFVLTSSSPYYKEVKLTLDGKAKESTISLSSSDNQAKKVTVEFFVSDKNEFLNNVQVTIDGQTKSTYRVGNINGYVSFELEQNKRFSYSVKTPCGNTKTDSYTTNAYSNLVNVKLSTTENCNTGTLTLKNTSKNPYTVKVGNLTFVMEGRTTKTLEVTSLETYPVSWEQNSGYLIYPTTGSYNAEFSQNRKNITVSFPD